MLSGTEILVLVLASTAAWVFIIALIRVFLGGDR